MQKKIANRVDGLKRRGDMREDSARHPMVPAITRCMAGESATREPAHPHGLLEMWVPESLADRFRKVWHP